MSFIMRDLDVLCTSIVCFLLGRHDVDEATGTGILGCHGNDARPQMVDSGSKNATNGAQISRFATPSPQASVQNSTQRTKQRILNHRRKAGSFPEFSEQDIIFPDSFELIYEPLPKIDGPPKCAEEGTFCETIDSYPYYHLRNVLQKNTIENTMYRELFGTDDVSVEISDRQGGEENRYVCATIERTIFPQVGKNKNNEWKFIINQGEDDGFVQGIRIETCRKPDTACDIIGDLPNGFLTSCKQKYVYRRMLAVNGTGSPSPDSFVVPSSCCCSYRRSLDFLARLGSSGGSSTERNIVD